MKLQHSTILITGGTNGIGLEFAKQLLEKGANVIVTGRNIENLIKTKEQFPEIHTIQCDIDNPDEIRSLHQQILKEFPDLNIIINNAGIMHSVRPEDVNMELEKVTAEIETNFSGTVRMIHQFLPHLMAKNASAIVNVTSGLAFIPFTISPIYCGTKAGVHVYTQALRLQLRGSNVKVFEVAPPKTDKPLQTAVPEAPNSRDMKVEDMVRIAIRGISKDKLEIRPGLSNVMKWMSRIAPDFFAKLIDKNIRKSKLQGH
ncbi:uncharacterized oxidoreductase [Chitinophaga sp. YR627]|uniref:SDR family oxidoreductase n=1 Tax=Chitinophaga sp. YR627 TaxID=1881041 RepID=UPI0008EB674C|nr:SDR family NAD(P)-dependent oxidoreductase [Chitinophaga sp. YR627]SFM63440.1 uncharacterized oxidoreductase [Chitinophaga sp. YR627]